MPVNANQDVESQMNKEIKEAIDALDQKKNQINALKIRLII